MNVFKEFLKLERLRQIVNDYDYSLKVFNFFVENSYWIEDTKKSEEFKNIVLNEIKLLKK